MIKRKELALLSAIFSDGSFIFILFVFFSSSSLSIFTWTMQKRWFLVCLLDLCSRTSSQYPGPPPINNKEKKTVLRHAATQKSIYFGEIVFFTKTEKKKIRYKSDWNVEKNWRLIFKKIIMLTVRIIQKFVDFKYIYIYIYIIHAYIFKPFIIYIFSFCSFVRFLWSPKVKMDYAS